MCHCPVKAQSVDSLNSRRHIQHNATKHVKPNTAKKKTAKTDIKKKNTKIYRRRGRKRLGCKYLHSKTDVTARNFQGQNTRLKIISYYETQLEETRNIWTERINVKY